jgi:hypothetical protein
LTVLGAAHGWIDLLERMLPDLLAAVLESWASVETPFADNREDAITTVLCRALRQNRTVRELPFYIHPQMVELEPAAGEDLGRMDIAFLPSGLPGNPSESIYFCLECKRLNVVKDGTLRRGGADYVTHGIRRFVRGRYASMVRYGGMLGYVLDGDVAGAIQNVEDNIRNQHQDLGMEPPGVLRPSAILRECPTARETDHQRVTGPTPFRVHHVFVDALGSPP